VAKDVFSWQDLCIDNLFFTFGLAVFSQMVFQWVLIVQCF
jgi:hypothetical protein